MVLQKESIRKVLFFTYLCMFMSFNNNIIMDDILRWGSFLLIFIYMIVEDLLNLNFKVNITAHTKWVVLFFIYILISSIWALDRNDALNKPYILSFVQIIIISYILGNWVETYDDAITYLRIYMFSICFMILVLFINTPFSMYGTQRLGNIIGLNSNDFGMRCSSGALIGLYFSQKNKKYYIVSLLFIIFGLLSGSRKVFFSLVIGYSIFFILNKKDITILRNVIIFFIITFIFYKIIINIPVFYNTIGRRVEIFLGSLGGAQGDKSIMLRKFYREVAFSMFLEKPIFGWGANGFVTMLRTMEVSVVTYSHNNYTELLSTLGIVGFILYYCLQLKIMFCSFKYYIKIGKKEFLIVFVAILVNIITEYYYVSFFTIATQLQILLYFLLIKCLCKKNNVVF